MLASGTAVGRYVVLDQLGEGAMGEVYRAWDNALDRVVALKLLLPMRAESAAARKRFNREARLSARINHPAVAHIYDVGLFDDVPFIAIEFVPGKQLRSEMNGPMPSERILALARQILDGLAEAHRQGVVHRDLKPENIMISGRDQVKLLDFGLAKPIYEDAGESTDLSHTGLTGTPRYMAPEQIQGNPIDARTDIYALGSVLYEMISGSPAHTGKTLGEMLMAVVHKPAPALTDDMCTPELAKIVKRALEKAPDARWPDAESMLAAIQGLGAKVEAPPPLRSPTRVPVQRAETYTLRGREALIGGSSSSSLAIDMLQQAIEIDPDYPMAHAVYAEACAALFNTGAVDASWLDRAQEALERAESLDPSLPDLRVARARIVWTKTFNFPAETALRELRWALRADPDHIGALRLWATITGHVGLIDQAAAAVARRLGKDPNDELMRLLSASMFIVDGRTERALDILGRIVRLDPKHEDALFWWTYGHTLAVDGQIESAADVAAKTLARHPEDPMIHALAALVAALQGKFADLDRHTETAQRSLRAELHPHHAYHLLALAHSAAGNVAASANWLRRTAEEGMPCYPWFARDPFLANVRGSEQGRELFAELERRYEFFKREFPLDDPATMSFVATEVS